MRQKNTLVEISAMNNCVLKKFIIKMNAKGILVNINIISLYIKFIKNIILEM